MEHQSWCLVGCWLGVSTNLVKGVVESVGLVSGWVSARCWVLRERFVSSGLAGLAPAARLSLGCEFWWCVVGGGCCVLFENCIVDAKHL